MTLHCLVRTWVMNLILLVFVTVAAGEVTLQVSLPELPDLLI
jgi:hypothetical protein